jgi:hypothetical protein
MTSWRATTCEPTCEAKRAASSTERPAASSTATETPVVADQGALGAASQDDGGAAALVKPHGQRVSTVRTFGVETEQDRGLGAVGRKHIDVLPARVRKALCRRRIEQGDRTYLVGQAQCSDGRIERDLERDDDDLGFGQLRGECLDMLRSEVFEGSGRYGDAVFATGFNQDQADHGRGGCCHGGRGVHAL